MTYLIKFYSKTWDKVRERRVDAPTLFQARLWLGLLKVRNTLKRLKR